MQPEEGYDRLRRLSVANVVELHEAAAAHGEKWGLGIRDPGGFDSLVMRIDSMARRGLAPGHIASSACHFVVASHPFWDANHRTGYALRIVLRAFDPGLKADPEEIERVLRAIVGEGLSESGLRRWVQGHLT